MGDHDQNMMDRTTLTTLIQGDTVDATTLTLHCGDTDTVRDDPLPHLTDEIQVIHA